MGIPQPKRQLVARLASKNLDSQFQALITEGLSCSPFEARGILDALHEVYGQYLQESASEILPGRLSLVAIDAEEPAGKPLGACQKRTITLTVHRGKEDDHLLARQGPTAWRRARIPDLLEEALSQGALLTREDLAYRVFFVSVRTISRDLAFLRAQPQAPDLPLRGTLHDIGPVITHRVQIVGLALDGHSQFEICRRTRHSPQAVSNYLSTFTRSARLAQQGLAPKEIAFLLQRGERLIQHYLDLYHEAAAAGGPRSYFMGELLAMGGGASPARETPCSAGGGKKSEAGASPDSPGGEVAILGKPAAMSGGDSPAPETSSSAGGGKKAGGGRRSRFPRRGGSDHG
jgi:hypothetical protein